jgi:NAD-dependent SIR2 family protein deacetylase
MSEPAGQVLRCVNCGRAIEGCACCDERDCPPPTCDRCLTTAFLRTIRPQYVHHGASLIEDATDAQRA